MLGHVTANPGPFVKICSQEICKTHLLYRRGYLEESLFNDENVALRLKNKFGSLRFVSCGSRGLESLQIEQFVSVYENNVWKFILAVLVLITVVMNFLRGSIFPLHSVTKITCLIKVLLEQSDPFPERFIKSEAFRFLISVTLLGGLVLSNAFKSNNVYNIVLPKQPLRFNTIDELIDDGYSVYSKLADILCYVYDLEDILMPTRAVSESYNDTKVLAVYTIQNIIIFLSETEINFYNTWTKQAPLKLIEKDRSLALYLINITGPHLGLHNALLEPLKV